MRYIIFGSFNERWRHSPAARVDLVRKEFERLNISVVATYYTEGQYDFVSVVEAPGADAIANFNIWYIDQGMGQLNCLPAFELMLTDWIMEPLDDAASHAEIDAHKQASIN